MSLSPSLTPASRSESTQHSWRTEQPTLFWKLVAFLFKTSVPPHPLEIESEFQKIRLLRQFVCYLCSIALLCLLGLAYCSYDSLVTLESLLGIRLSFGWQKGLFLVVGTFILAILPLLDMLEGKLHGYVHSSRLEHMAMCRELVKMQRELEGARTQISSETQQTALTTSPEAEDSRTITETSDVGVPKPVVPSPTVLPTVQHIVPRPITTTSRLTSYPRLRNPQPSSRRPSLQVRGMSSSSRPTMPALPTTSRSSTGIRGGLTVVSRPTAPRGRGMLPPRTQSGATNSSFYRRAI